ncbi:hypothetical protein ID850_18785 [Xenorhabdus sp. Flor]|nr:hypothetical protein [Xenorhabdus sp. Flor]
MVKCVKTLALYNPKRITEKEYRAEWYSYYAGFSHTFVRDVLRKLNPAKDAIILDPWNGAGTTTLASALEGYEAIGIDLNPTMEIIARAKLSTKEDIKRALEIVKHLRVNILPKNILNNDDYLLNWFSSNTASYFRYISNSVIKKRKSISDSKINSVIFLALFNVARELVSKFIPSNPTWVKKAKKEEDKITICNKEIKKRVIEFLHQKIDTILESDFSKKISLCCASSTCIPVFDNTIDIIVTSPPYCTRIDYGIATSPELAVLLGNDPSKIDYVRRSLIGRTTIDKKTYEKTSFGNTADTILNKILNHNSHASSTYYYKNYNQYFHEIKKSISEISRVLKVDGIFVCVVQDSYYKEIYCDLAEILIEMAKDHNLEFISRKDFNAKLVMANIHKGTKKYRPNISAKESILVFKSIN